MQGGIMMEATVAGSIGSRLSEFFSNSKNYGSYPEIETLWDQYNKSVDPKVRKDLIGRIQKIMYDKAMLVTLCENRSPAAYGPRLKGSPYGIQGGYPIWYPTPMEDLELNE
jgi:ABC-type transport system substrate-binding protein